MGSGPKQPTPQQQMPSMAIPDPVELQTQGWGGQGYNMPQNAAAQGSPATGVGTAPPPWMQGIFAAPWWGQQAPNVGASLYQQGQPQQMPPAGPGMPGQPGAQAGPPMGMPGQPGAQAGPPMGLPPPVGPSAPMAPGQGPGGPPQMGPYAQDREWMNSVGVPMGLDRYTGMPQQQQMSQEDQQWLQQNHPWAAMRG